MLPPGAPAGAAVSGGPDSMALLHVLLDLREKSPFPLIVLHLNHGLRGSESDGDEAFVRSVLRPLDSPFDPGRSPSRRSSGTERLPGGTGQGGAVLLLRGRRRGGGTFADRTGPPRGRPGGNGAHALPPGSGLKLLKTYTSNDVSDLFTRVFANIHTVARFNNQPLFHKGFKQSKEFFTNTLNQSSRSITSPSCWAESRLTVRQKV